MPLNWMDLSDLSIYHLLLLERVQISWLPMFNLPGEVLSAVLKAYPSIDWFLAHKCPEVAEWLEEVKTKNSGSNIDLRQAELEILRSFEDLIVYAHDPAVYDAQPFLKWDSNELLQITDFSNKRVADIGSGTGRLAFTVSPEAREVFAIEPVENLRRYINEKAELQNMQNVFPVDGTITDIPFPNGFFDITMGGHVFGDYPEAEYRELARVTKPGGQIILCPGNNDLDNDRHSFLLNKGFDWSRFEEPRDGIKRKYWKTV